ncbi:MAG TPA: hypothetical protein VGR02_00915 [Thermoanaerobaculia bacterium]|jgi:hypothetical protein|nr:hypothetical protein [Thermoanaerobaculia bacterium]
MRRKDTVATRPLNIGKGAGSTARLIRPGDLNPLAEANLFYCLEAGGHLVRTNSCPIHHGPTTRYGGD